MDDQDFKLLLRDAFPNTPPEDANEWTALRSALRKLPPLDAPRPVQGPGAAVVQFGLGLMLLVAAILWLPDSNQASVNTAANSANHKSGSMLDLDDNPDVDYDQSLANAVTLVDATSRW